jgi:hypothetical protein
MNFSTLSRSTKHRVDSRGISGLRANADISLMGTFFQAWRRRQAEQQAAEWTQEQEEARHAVEELPDVLREQARRAVDTLLEGRDEEVAGALEDLDHLLEPHPELRDRFFRLRVVDDAVEFLGPDES